MHQQWDEDEWETVVESRPCSCRAENQQCDGRCNGSFGIGMKRRDPTEVRRIKAERLRKDEDDILREADAIRARRRHGTPEGT